MSVRVHNPGELTDNPRFMGSRRQCRTVTCPTKVNDFSSGGLIPDCQSIPFKGFRIVFSNAVTKSRQGDVGLIVKSYLMCDQIPARLYRKIIVASRIIWHTSELIIWRTSCESGVKRLGKGIFRGNMKL